LGNILLGWSALVCVSHSLVFVKLWRLSVSEHWGDVVATITDHVWVRTWVLFFTVCGPK